MSDVKDLVAIETAKTAIDSATRLINVLSGWSLGIFAGTIALSVQISLHNLSKAEKVNIEYLPILYAAFGLSALSLLAGFLARIHLTNKLDQIIADKDPMCQLNTLGNLILWQQIILALSVGAYIWFAALNFF